jgi:hypothetical protein
MQQQHLMQMNQGMMGGYAASPTPVTTDLIQQVIIPSPKSLFPFFASPFSYKYMHVFIYYLFPWCVP